MKKGLAAVQEAAERSTSSGGSSRYIGWKAGEVKTIRFLLDGDDVVLTNLHEFVACADETRRSFVCRTEVGAACPLCENGTKKREVGFGIALVREEKPDRSGFVTKVEEVDVEENGKTVRKVVPVVGILHQAPRNFWSGAGINDAFEKRGTLLDRDYTITRRGAKLDTTYTAYPEDAVALDLEKFAEFQPNLEELLKSQCQKEYYDKFLFGIDTQSGSPSTSASADLSQEEIAALKAANAEVVTTASSGDWN